MTSAANEVLLSVDQETFDQLVLQSDVPVLIDFWAEWCGYCKPLIPILETIAQDSKYKNRIKIFKLNIDHSRLIAQKYGIRSIPMMILFKDGQAKQSLLGLKSEQEIRRFLEEHI